MLPHIEYVAVFPPPEFLWPGILSSLIRLSQFCESSQSSISLALAAELVVLASSNSLKTAHHRMFLFGPAFAMQIRAKKNSVQETEALGLSNVRKRRLEEESMAVIAEALIALGSAPLRFTAQICTKDASQQARILDNILCINSNTTNVHSHLPLEVYSEVVSNFRQQVQLALSQTDCPPSPLFFCIYDDSTSLESNQESEDVIVERSFIPSSHQSHMQNEPSSSLASAHAADESPSNFRSLSASLLRGIVAQVVSRFESSNVENTSSHIRIFLEPVCSKFLQSIVLQASQKYFNYINSSVPISFSSDFDLGSSHTASSFSASSNHAHDTNSIVVQPAPIFGRHPSYRVPVPEVEVVSFEQINPVWTHQCKPGSRICVLLRCHQRLSGVLGKD
jgi:hypothetical protein